MTNPHEPLESIAERARRALRDNDEARLQAQLTTSEVRTQGEPRPDGQGLGGRLPLHEAHTEEARRLSMEARVLAEQVQIGSVTDVRVPAEPSFRRDPAAAPTWMQPVASQRPLPVPEAEEESPFAALPAWMEPNESVYPHGERPVRNTEPAAPLVMAPVPELQEVQAPMPQSPVRMPESRADAASLVDRRMRAIYQVRELEPRRTCFRQRVHELQQRLSHTPTDSVHYAHLLARLAEAHGELNRLEGHIEEAQHIIRSTEWLMEMLTDPTRSRGRPAAEELDTLVP